MAVFQRSYTASGPWTITKHFKFCLMSSSNWVNGNWPFSDELFFLTNRNQSAHDDHFNHKVSTYRLTQASDTMGTWSMFHDLQITGISETEQILETSTHCMEFFKNFTVSFLIFIRKILRMWFYICKHIMVPQSIHIVLTFQKIISNKNKGSNI